MTCGKDHRNRDVKRLPVGNWTVSKLQAFWMCPFRWWEIYGEGRHEDEPETMDRLKGHLVHEVLAEMRLSYLATGADVRNSNSAANMVANECRKRNLPGDFQEEIQELCYHALRNMDCLPPRKHVAAYWVERPFAFSKDWQPIQTTWVAGTYAAMEPGAGAIHWGQKSDTIFQLGDGSLHLWDDKTGWARMDEFQLLAYAHGACKWIERTNEEADGVVPSHVPGTLRPKIEVTKVHVRYNLLAQNSYAEADPLDPADVQDFPQWLEDETTRILNTQEWAPKLCRACKWCGFKPECPLYQDAGKQMVEQGRIPVQVGTLPDAERAGMFLLVAEDLIREVKERTRDFVEDFGGPVPIPDTGKELAIRGLTTWQGNLSEIIPALRAVGIKDELIREKLTISKGALETIVKAATPLRGTKEHPIIGQERADNAERRKEWMAAFLHRGEWKPRKGTFGVYNEK